MTELQDLVQCAAYAVVAAPVVFGAITNAMSYGFTRHKARAWDSSEAEYLLEEELSKRWTKEGTTRYECVRNRAFEEFFFRPGRALAAYRIRKEMRQ